MIRSAQGAIETGLVSKASKAALAGILSVSLVPISALANENENEKPVDTTATNIESTGQDGSSDGTVSNYTTLAASTTYKDDTYTGTATCSDEDEAAVEEGDEWLVSPYTVEVEVSIQNGTIASVSLCDSTRASAVSNTDTQNLKYINWAVDGRTYKGTTYQSVITQINEKKSTEGIDTVSGATVTSKAIIAAVDNALEKSAAAAAADSSNQGGDGTQNGGSDSNPSTGNGSENDGSGSNSFDGSTLTSEKGYSYVYAALSYGEYWAAEGVYAAGDTTSVDARDSRTQVEEYDLGAFDAVSRATTTHGIHRGSYQGYVVVYTGAGKYYINSFDSDISATLVDGTKVSVSKADEKLYINGNEMINYEVLGIKYVPVKVATKDLEAFKANYQTVENGSTLSGGYSEQNLKSYSVTAAVDENTYGLKVATKNEDGSFTFSARTTQDKVGSGVYGQDLKTVDTSACYAEIATPGTFGEFLRVDLKGDYGDLGANMQAVTWTYYGDGDTPLRTYGTKFAADNWMHKKLGIQLGLTDSLRCQLPAGTDGTGKWEITVSALGYTDTTYTVNVTSDNISTTKVAVTDKTKQALFDLVATAKELKQSDYTSLSWKSSAFEDELKESEDLLALEGLGETECAEQIKHLQAAMDSLVLIADGTAVDVSLDGATVQYKLYEVETADATKFTYNGTDYWYKAVGSAIEADVYTNVAVTNKAFYQAMGMSDGGFDVVSTATQQKISNFTHAVSTSTEDGGTDVTGIKVPVSIAASDYVKAKLLQGASLLGDEGGYSAIAAITDAKSTSDGTTMYGTMDANGAVTLSSPKNVQKVEGATATITTTSTWGDYEIDITDVENGPINGTATSSNASSDKTGSSQSGVSSDEASKDGATDSKSEQGNQQGNQQGGHGSSSASNAKISSDSILGMTITATGDYGNGVTSKTYSMGYLVNIWFKPGELSWYVDGNQTTTKNGAPTNYEQFADIFGKTVTNVTYYTTNGVFDYDLTSSNLFVKYQLSSNAEAAFSVTCEDGFSYAGFDVQAVVPAGADYNYVLNSVGYKKGKTTTALTVGDDYTFSWNDASVAENSNTGLATLADDAEGDVATKAGTIHITEAGAAKIASLASASTGTGNNGGTYAMSQTPQLTVTFLDTNNEDLSSSVSLGNIPSLDTRELEKLLDSVDGLKAADYTADSWKKLTDALAAINEATAEDSASSLTQDELNALVAVANDAYDDLVNDATDPEPGNGDDKNQNPGNNDEKDDGKGDAVEPGAGSEENTDKDKESSDKVANPDNSDDDNSNGSDDGSDAEKSDGEQATDGDNGSASDGAVSATDIEGSSSGASALTQTGDTAATAAAGAGIFGLLAAAFAALASRRRSSVK